MKNGKLIKKYDAIDTTVKIIVVSRTLYFLGEIFMKNTYKTRLYRVLLNLVFGAAAALFVAFIASIWLKSALWFVLIFAAFLALYIRTVIIGNMIVIETDGAALTVKQGKKVDTYPLDTTSIRAKTVTSGGETACTLYLTRQGENETEVNCELIGIAQFEKLLGDLGINGDPVTKLDTVTELDTAAANQNT